MATGASDFNIYQFLASAGGIDPQRPFLIEPSGRTLSYAEALTQTRHIAGWMAAKGVGQGDRVLIILQNAAEVPLLAFAAAKIGAIFSVLSPQLKAERFGHIVRQCEPALIVVEDSTATLLPEDLNVPVVFVGGTPPPESGWTHFEDLLAASPHDGPVAQGGDLPAFLVFTSGSTGTPRGAILSHANVGFVTPAILQRLAYTETDRIGLFLPLAFDYGLYQVFLAAQMGACILLARPEMAGVDLPRLLAAHAITVLPAVPVLLAGLIKTLRFRPAPLPALRMITSTGDHLPRTHIHQIRDLLPRVRVFPMFGLTECKRVSILLPEQLATHSESVGRPLRGTQVWAEDSNGARLPPGEVGQLTVKGPHVSLGYWRDPAGTAERFRLEPDGSRVLLTGDIGAVDAEGFIHFHSRSEHVIKHRGHRLSPAEIEEAACRHPKIVAAGCIRDDLRDALCLFVATAGAPPEPATVLADLATRVERAKLPDRIVFMDDLPRTPNQKVDRAALRSILAGFH